VLGKAFAQRQGGVRQRKAAVTTVIWTPSLPSASSLALGKEQNIFFENFFAECLQASAQQRANHFFLIFFPSASNKVLGKGENFVFKTILCLAPPGWRSANDCLCRGLSIWHSAKLGKLS